MTVFAIFKPIEWITVCIISLIAATINIKILFNEVTKRRSTEMLSVNKWLNIWSLLAMICFPIWSLLNAIEYFPIMCHWAHAADTAFINIAPCMIGFYQLSRLYYCFSSNQAYSKKGYSTFTFIVMYSLGIWITICNVCIGIFNTIDISGQCGINDKYEYFSVVWTDHGIDVMWIYAGLGIFIIWDWITLALYTMKSLQLRKYVMTRSPHTTQTVYVRIMKILSGLF